MRQLPTKHLDTLRTAQHSYEIENDYRKGIHFDTTGSRLRPTSNPHQHQINQQRLYTQRGQIDTAETGGSRTSGIKECLRPFIRNRHPRKRSIPFESGNRQCTDYQKQKSHYQHNLRIQIIKMMHLVPFQLTGTDKPPEMTQMI